MVRVPVSPIADILRWVSASSCNIVHLVITVQHGGESEVPSSISKISSFEHMKTWNDVGSSIFALARCAQEQVAASFIAYPFWMIVWMLIELFAFLWLVRETIRLARTAIRWIKWTLRNARKCLRRGITYVREKAKAAFGEPITSPVAIPPS